MRDRVVSSGLLALCVVFAGCAYTNISSYKDPEHQEMEVEGIIVYIITEGMENERILENAITSELSRLGYEVQGGLDAFPPTRGRDNQSIGEAFARSPNQSLLKGTFRSGKSSRHECMFIEWDFYVKGKGGLYKAWTGRTCTKGKHITPQFAVPGALDDLAETLVGRLFEDEVLSTSTKRSSVRIYQ